jgi:hypothetical protein
MSAPILESARFQIQNLTSVEPDVGPECGVSSPVLGRHSGVSIPNRIAPEGMKPKQADSDTNGH